jgi:Xaa-Pro dipeptidase
MNTTLQSGVEKDLLIAREKAQMLFRETEQRGFMQPGVTEKELSERIYQLAQELFGIRKYWHKRVVRAGINTLHPYRENPPNLTIQENDLLFLDLGPVFDEWEADFGRTFLIGRDSLKQKMIDDLEIVFTNTKQYFQQNDKATGKELFDVVVQQSKRLGWDYGGPHAGHLIGVFPHEKLLGDSAENYICTDNDKPMRALDINSATRHWILEVHLVDLERQYGAFYEDLLTLDY